MNAAETSASSAIADWMLLTLVSRSRATAVIDTFIIDVSTTRTNIAMPSSTDNRRLPDDPSGPRTAGSPLTGHLRTSRDKTHLSAVVDF